MLLLFISSDKFFTSELNNPHVIMQKYSMFMAQIGCAAIGVLALTIFGPGWLARSASIAASVAYMICTNSVHPPGIFFFNVILLSFE